MQSSSATSLSAIRMPGDSAVVYEPLRKPAICSFAPSVRLSLKEERLQRENHCDWEWPDVDKLRITEAVSLADRAAVYSFRYRVIVEQLGIPIPGADHARQMIADQEDAPGRLLMACRGRQVIGTVRMNFLRDGRVEPHDTLLNLSALGAFQRRVSSATSRLLVAPSQRGVPVAIRLMQACYRLYRSAGMKWDHIVVHRDLVRMYTRLGYRPLGPSVEHPEIGEAHPLRLELDNHQFLLSIGSIFLRCREDLL